MNARLVLTGIAVVVVAALVAIPLGGIEYIKVKAGITTLIDNPEVESPEWVVREAIKAAMEPDEKVGWRRFRELMHSDQLVSLVSEKSWRQMNFKYFRFKVKLYLPDESKPDYERVRVQDIPPGYKKIFVYNKRSDVPTPCWVIRDPRNGNKWRINRCSL